MSHHHLTGRYLLIAHQHRVPPRIEADVSNRPPSYRTWSSKSDGAPGDGDGADGDGDGAPGDGVLPPASILSQ